MSRLRRLPKFRRAAHITLIVTALVAGLTTVLGIVGPTSASAAAPLRCDQNTIYGIDPAGNMRSINVNTGAAAPITNMSPANNGLGMTNNGLNAWAILSGGTGNRITRYDTVTGNVTPYTITGAPNTAIRGAINPVNGLFYYGGDGTNAFIGAFNTNTATNIGQIGTLTGLLDQNGDFAFSSLGLLFVAAGSEIRRVTNTSVPTTAGTGNLATTLVADLPGVNSPGITFASDGLLYVSSGTTLFRLNPATGATLATLPLSFAATDLASCTYPNTISAKKIITQRLNPGDQFNLAVTGGGIVVGPGSTTTTTGSAAGLQAQTAGAALAVPAAVYTFTETASGTTNLSNYTSSYSCINTHNPGVILASGAGSTGTVTFPAAVSSTGTDVVCTFTNTPKTASLQLTKTLSGNRNTDSDQFTVALRSGSAAGPVLNATTNSTTTGAGATVTAGTGTTAAATVVANRTYYLTENPSGTTNLGNYQSRITCVDGAGLQTGLPTNAAFSGSLAITPVNNAVISCTLSNQNVKSYTVAKSATVNGQPVTSVKPGDVVSYRIDVTNTGQVAYAAGALASFADDLSAVLDDATGPSTIIGGATFDAGTQVLSWTGALTVGQTKSITYRVTVTGSGDSVLRNTVITTAPSGNCPPGSTAGACSVTLPVAQYTVAKTVTGAAVPGGVLTYSIRVTNTGQVAYGAGNQATLADNLSDVLDDAAGPTNITGGATYDSGTKTLNWAGDLGVPGDTAIITYQVTVTDPATSGGNANLRNAVVTPSGGNCPAGQTVAGCATSTPVSAYTVTKAVTSVGTITPGSTVTYAVTVRNTGQTAYTAQTPAVLADDLSDVLDDASFISADSGATLAAGVLSWSGSLAIGQTVTITYSVLVNTPPTGDARLVNVVSTPPGSGGNCVAGAVACSTDSPVARFAVSKVASTSTALPGETVGYTIVVTNTGQVPYTTAAPASFSDNLAGVLDDANLGTLPAGLIETAGVLSWSGAIPVGDSVTLNYSVTVRDPSSGDHLLANTVIPSGPDGFCDSSVGCTTTVALQSFQVIKTADATAANGGQIVTYTITVTNTGQVDYTAAAPASFSDDLTAVLAQATGPSAITGGAIFDDGTQTLSWSGPLQIGASTSFTYAITLNDPVIAVLTNTVTTPTGSGGNCAPGSTDALCTWNLPARSFSVVKAADRDTAQPGETVSYTVTVTNTGASAYTETDPASFIDDLSAVNDDATYNGDANNGAVYEAAAELLSWSGTLGVGSSQVISYSVTVNDPHTGNGLLRNTILTPVGGSCPADTTAAGCQVDVTVQKFQVSKTVDAGSVRAGGVVDYTIEVRNTGQVPYTAADLASFTDDLSFVLDDAAYNNDATATTGNLDYLSGVLTWSGELPVAGVVTIRYSVTTLVGGNGDHRLQNSVRTPTESAGNCPTGTTDTACSTIVLVQEFAVVKAVDAPTVLAGGVLTYTVTVTNSGAVDYTAADPAAFSDSLAQVLDDAAYNEASATADIGTVTYDAGLISWSGPLTVNQSATITYAVTVGSPATGDKTLNNAVLTPPGSGGNCLSGTTCSTNTAVQQFTVAKQTDVTSVQPGGVVNYTVTVTNTGQVAYSAASFTDSLTGVLDDATFQDNALATAGTASFTAPNLTWTGPLAIGATVTVTYSVKVTDPAAGDQILVNSVRTPPGSAGSCPMADAPDCSTTTPVQQFSVVKTATAPTVRAGEELTYFITVTNTGAVDYSVANPASFTDDLSGVLDEADYTGAADNGAVLTGNTLSWSGALAAGASVVISYTVTVKLSATGDQQLRNSVVTPPAGGGNCPSGSEAPDCTSVVDIQQFSIVKTASVESVKAGGVVNYQLTVTNTGTVGYTVENAASFIDDLGSVLDDAIYNQDATTSGGQLSYLSPALSWSGGLAPGESVVINYSVTVNQPATGDQILANLVVTPRGSGGSCPSGTEADCSIRTPVQQFSITKSADSATARAGGIVKYTVTLTNTGEVAYTADDPAGFADDLSVGVLDDAVFNNDASGGATYAAPVLSWSGELAVGGSVEITYSVTVNTPATGDQELANTVVTPAGAGGDCPTGAGRESCSVNVPIQQFTISKVADTTAIRAGGVVAYTISLTNGSDVDYTTAVPASFTDDLSQVLDDAVYNGDVSDPDAKVANGVLTWSGALASGQTKSITYSVTVFTSDKAKSGNRLLANTVRTPLGSGGDCPAGATDLKCTALVDIQQFSVTKVALSDTVKAGDTVDYSITVTNTGRVGYTDLDPASFTDDLSDVLDDGKYNNDANNGATYSAPVLSWQGALALGESVVITYSVTTGSTPADTRADRELRNTVITPPGSGGGCEVGSDNVACTSVVPVLSYSVVKTADQTSTQPGDVLTYTLVITNVGTVDIPASTPAQLTDDLSDVLDDAAYNNDATNGAVFADGTLTWSGALPVGGSATITYSVTVNAPAAGNLQLVNTVTTPPGSGGGCPSGSTSPNCSVTVPVALYSVTKTVDNLVASPGAKLTYTITVTNTGSVAFTASNPAGFTDDLTQVLDDAVYNGDATGGAVYQAPVLTWSGPLPVGETVKVTYSVTIVELAIGDGNVINRVSSLAGSGGDCLPGSTDSNCGVTSLIQTFDVTKTVDNSESAAGTVVNYAITVTNTGRAAYTAAQPAGFTDDLTRVLDDATYNNDATSGAVYLAPNLSWSGPLAVGEVVTVRYSVTVSVAAAGDASLINGVEPLGRGGHAPEAPVVTKVSAAKPLPNTGFAADTMLGWSLLLLMAGAALAFGGRRRLT